MDSHSGSFPHERTSTGSRVSSGYLSKCAGYSCRKHQYDKEGGGSPHERTGIAGAVQASKLARDSSGKHRQDDYQCGAQQDEDKIGHDNFLAPEGVLTCSKSPNRCAPGCV